MKQTLIALWLTLMTLFSVAVYAEQEVENLAEPHYEGIATVVNINQADAEELATLLQGVGIKKAQSIIEYRKQHGPFNTADDLSQVSGIGLATVEKNRQRIVL